MVGHPKTENGGESSSPGEGTQVAIPESRSVLTGDESEICCCLRRGAWFLSRDRGSFVLIVVQSAHYQQVRLRFCAAVDLP